LNPEEVKEGVSPAAANSLRSPPLDRYQEQSFQQLCLLWRIRDQFWPDIDEPAARQAFTLAWAEYGEAILAQHNVYPGDYIMARAKVWIAGVDSPQFLKKLEVWLGAPVQGQRCAVVDERPGEESWRAWWQA
jgi:hypothetical protein